MKSKRQANSQSPVDEVGVLDLDGIKLRRELVLGDVVWIPIRNLWWPAQVVDEDMISESYKPSKRTKSQVLLRLYGTYTYVYRDPTKFRFEFEKILKQNNGSYSELFQKALEQDLSHLKSSRSKRGVSKTRGKANVETPEDDNSKQDRIKKNIKVEASKSANPMQESPLKKNKTNSPGSVKQPLEENLELSVRRVRVMQTLGLAAPCGSPFRKNGTVLSIDL